jgi:aryl-alcohol dehydrogenase-like predicted oxidoreductase
MQQRLLGRSGLAVSRLGLGISGWGREVDEDEAATQLKVFRDAGGTLIETAESYGDGAAEFVLGELLGDGSRDELVVISRSDGARGSRKDLLSAVDATLSRLGTDYVDVWQLAGWDSAVPLEETLSALDVVVSSGRARYAGVAGLTGWQLAAASTWQSAFPGRTPIVSALAPYSLLDRGAEDELIAAARACGVGVLAAAPLARGVLSGKYRGGMPADSRGASSPDNREAVRPYLDEWSRQIVEALCTAADGLGVAPIEVALAWVRDRSGVAAAVVGARTAGQLTAALASEQLDLPSEIAGALSDVSAA